MKKNISLILIIALLAALALCLVACDDGDVIYNVEPYTAYEITHVDIVQSGANTFDYVLTSDIEPSATARVYLTRYDKISSDAAAIDYEIVDGKYSFTQEVRYASYYIQIVDGDRLAVLPLTRPQMAPTLSTVEKNKVLTYNFVNGTSWSSFCDPTGKSVYKSSKTSLDDSATLIATEVNIFGADTTTDVLPSESEPYYFVVLSAKNGVVRYVSAPIMQIDKAYTDLSVELKQIEGKPYLQVNGRFVIDGDVALELYSADTKLGKVVEIIGDKKSGKAGDSFEVLLDATEVVSGKSGAGIWYDIKLATASGSLYELSSSMADMTQAELYGNITFEFKEWYGVLKLNYAYYDCTVTSINIENDANGVPTLYVRGISADEVSKVRLHFDAEYGGEKHHYYSENLSKEAGEFEFEMKLTDIPYNSSTPWCWFHLDVYKNGSTTAYNRMELNRGNELKLNQSFVYNGVRYSIRNTDSMQLVIQAEKA